MIKTPNPSPNSTPFPLSPDDARIAARIDESHDYEEYHELLARAARTLPTPF